MNKPISDYLSVKFHVLSAILMLMVLYNHTLYNAPAEYGGFDSFQRFIAKSCKVASPLFFVISGFLFFRLVPEGMKSIGGKMKKRVRTLLRPYLLANILTFVFCVVMNIIANNVEAISNVMNFRVLDTVNQGLWPTLKMVFISPPIAFQLWFVRDLMIFVAFSPLLYLVIKWLSALKYRYYMIVIFCIAIFSLYYFLKIEICQYLFYFSLGGFLAWNCDSICFNRSNRLLIVTFFLGVVFVILNLLESIGKISWDNFVCFSRLIGVPFVWLMYDAIRNGKYTMPTSGFWSTMIKLNFFVYLVHEPLLNIFKKVPLLINQSEAMMIACYIIVPIIAYITFAYLGSFLKSKLPKVYKIYTGSR